MRCQGMGRLPNESIPLYSRRNLSCFDFDWCAAIHPLLTQSWYWNAMEMLSLDLPSILFVRATVAGSMKMSCEEGWKGKIIKWLNQRKAVRDGWIDIATSSLEFCAGSPKSFIRGWETRSPGLVGRVSAAQTRSTWWRCRSARFSCLISYTLSSLFSSASSMCYFTERFHGPNNSYVMFTCLSDYVLIACLYTHCSRLVMPSTDLKLWQ